MNRFTKRFGYSIILLKQLVKTDFKLRYQGSFLGYLWSLLRPLALFLILYVVFVKFLKVGNGIPHYPVYLLLGIVLWNFFLEVTSGSVSSVVGKGDLLRKINFPKYVIVVAGSVAALINVAINLTVVAVFMILNGVDVKVAYLWFVPLLMLELLIFSMGIAFFLSAAYVKFRDIGYIWEVITQGLFYATPILYPLSILPIYAQKLLILNPIGQVIQDARYILVTTSTHTISDIYGGWAYRLIPIGVTLVIFGLSAMYFKHSSKFFAENV